MGQGLLICSYVTAPAEESNLWFLCYVIGWEFEDEACRDGSALESRHLRQ
jgi:hypothetical protein